MEVGKAINDGGFLKEFSLISLKGNTSIRRTKKARSRSPLRIHQRLNHEHSDRVALNWFVFNDERRFTDSKISSRNSLTGKFFSLSALNWFSEEISPRKFLARNFLAPVSPLSSPLSSGRSPLKLRVQMLSQHFLDCS